jgi:hypothetical protein
MCKYEKETWTGFKDFVQQKMTLWQKAIEEMSLNSLLGAYLIGADTGREKSNIDTCLLILNDRLGY